MNYLIIIFTTIAVITIIYLYLLFTHSIGNDNRWKWKRPNPIHNVLTKWGWMVSHPNKLHIGDNVDIGAFTYIQAENIIHLQDNVQIGSNCAIYSKNTIENIKCKIIIKENAKIGAGTIIIPHKDLTELVIGENAIIGANSVVRYNIPDNTVSAGSPLKIIRYNSSARGNNYESGL